MKSQVLRALLRPMDGRKAFVSWASEKKALEQVDTKRLQGDEFFEGLDPFGDDLDA